MRVLGFTLGHDCSIALIEDGKVIGIMEAERYFRQKRYKLHAFTLGKGKYPSGYQYVDIEELILTLEIVKKEWGNEFDMVAVQNQGREDEYSNLLTLLRREGIVFNDSFHVDHHLSHAALAFYTSPYSEALVLSYDGMGNDGYTIFFKANGKTGLEYLERDETRFGQSYNNLGFILGTRPDVAGTTAGKTMGLTSYGETRQDWLPHAAKYVRQYRKLPGWPVEGLPSHGKGHKINAVGLLDIPELSQYVVKVDYSQPDGLWDALNTLISWEEANVEIHMPGLDNKICQDLAKTVQTAWTNEVMTLLAKFRGVSKNLCVVGGCALNGITNYEIEKTGWFDSVHLVPNPSDCGISAGAALYAYYQKSNKSFEGYGQYYSPYLGLEPFDREDLPALKQKYPHREFTDGEMSAKLAGLVYQNLIVGVVRGRYEAGPRALGNRTILCNPLHPDMRDILNEKVKHREWYRPFAPITTSEDAGTYFTNESDIPYMSVICYTRPQYVEALPSITHVDQSARVQTVKRDWHPFMHDTLKEFEKLSGMPIMLNTSFNPGGEPILNYYHVALEMLENTGLDLVLINNTLFCKVGAESLLTSI